MIATRTFSTVSPSLNRVCQQASPGPMVMTRLDLSSASNWSRSIGLGKKGVSGPGRQDGQGQEPDLDSQSSLLAT
jgi:hypothetical protein